MNKNKFKNSKLTIPIAEIVNEYTTTSASLLDLAKKYSCSTTAIVNRLKSRGIKLKIGKNKGKDSKHFGGYEDISGKYWYSIKRWAKARKLECSVTLPYLWNLFLEQNRKCKLSGLDIFFAKSFELDEQTASLDRIDSKLGYIESNIQWVHKDINSIKWNSTQEDFISMCKDVYKTSVGRTV